MVVPFSGLDWGGRHNVKIPAHNISTPCWVGGLDSIKSRLALSKKGELEVSMHPLNLLSTKIDLLERIFHVFYE